MVEMTIIRWFKCIRCLLAGGNWNNAGKAGVGYLNANNTASNVNSNIGTRLELRKSDPEHHLNQNQSNLVKHIPNHPEVLVLLGKFFWNGRAEL